MQRRWATPFLFLCAAIATSLLVYPLVIIQPFKYQTSGNLQRALLVFQIAPTTELIVALLALATLLLCWRAFRRRARVIGSLLLTITLAAAILVRVNIFEQMFHPAGTPRFIAVHDSKLDARDMLITVTLNNNAHAYPVREMGYHHLVNDFVGGVPVVATY